MDFQTFINWLEEHLTPYYSPPLVKGGHDLSHVKEIIRQGKRIKEKSRNDNRVPSFDTEEFEAAAWLHNLDRAESLIEADSNPNILKNLCFRLLKESPFDNEAEERIVNVVVEHGERDDSPNASGLLVAIRNADRLSRMGPLALIHSSQSLHSAPAYNPLKPFSYKGDMPPMATTPLEDVLKILNWTQILPDWARELLDDNFRNLVEAVRMIGTQIASQTGLPNRIEEDLKTALGPYYEEWQNKQTSSIIS